jgi:Phage integrase family
VISRAAAFGLRVCVVPPRRPQPRTCLRRADTKDETRAALDWLGRERALIYKTLVLTGLRRGELESLTVGQLHLDDAVPYARLDADDEKNRKGADIVLRDDLADDLRHWLADKLQRWQAEARNRGEAIPMRLPGAEPLFIVPVELVKIPDRDLKLAGIPKVDDRGRKLDVHALRHTFGTLLSKGGVAPRTAQEAMRHKDIDLTMNVYTDPRLLEVRGALDALPMLPLNDGQADMAEAARATGTDGLRQSPLAPTLAPTFDKRVQKQTSPVKTAGVTASDDGQGGLDVTSDVAKKKEPLTITVNDSLRAGERIRTADVQLGKLAFYH